MLGMMRDDDLADRLAVAEAVAAPHLRRLGLGDAGIESRTGDGFVVNQADRAIAGIPGSDIPDLRLVLLARIAASELATSGSTYGQLGRRWPGGDLTLAVGPR